VAKAAESGSLAPLERLVRLLSVLWAAGREGVPGPDLLAVGAYGAAGLDDRRRQFHRDLAHLNALGYDIRNVRPEGTDGRYRLVARDNRLRVELTPEQQVELVRAAQVAGQPELADRVGLGVSFSSAADQVRVKRPTADQALDAVLRAAARRCLVRFTYKGRVRVVHPHVVRSGPSGWYLAGREDTSADAKVFVVDRMSDVRIDQPGTADPVAAQERRSLDPLGWEVDPPVEAVVETTPEHRQQVERALGATAVDSPGDPTLLRVRVTHRAAFRHRLYELGTRVRLRGPAGLRRELLDELAEVAGTEQPATGER
jgi:predicted DNA-binding transcriptional regulator YafY